MKAGANIVSAFPLVNTLTTPGDIHLFQFKSPILLDAAVETNGG